MNKWSMWFMDLRRFITGYKFTTPLMWTFWNLLTNVVLGYWEDCYTSLSTATCNIVIGRTAARNLCEI